MLDPCRARLNREIKGPISEATAQLAGATWDLVLTGNTARPWNAAPKVKLEI